MEPSEDWWQPPRVVGAGRRSGCACRSCSRLHRRVHPLDTPSSPSLGVSRRERDRIGAPSSRHHIRSIVSVGSVVVLLLGLISRTDALHVRGCQLHHQGAKERGGAQHLRGGQGWQVPGFVSCTVLCFASRSQFGGKNKKAFCSASTLPPLGDVPQSSSGPDKLSEGGRRVGKLPLLLSPSYLFSLFLSKVPKVVRYAISCLVANVLYFGLYTLLLGSISSAGLCVNLAYLASVVWQHALHRILVYGKGIEINALYWKELFGIYMAYGIAFILNPIITEGCIAMGQVHPRTPAPLFRPRTHLAPLHTHIHVEMERRCRDGDGWPLNHVYPKP